jgi:hypothetical protein
MANSWLGRLLRGLRTVVRGPRTPASTTRAPCSVRHAALPDFDGRLTPTYAPRRDREADPGEVVWTWVPFEDDPSQGKDRPVLVVGRDEAYLLGLMLTSKDHSRNAEREARAGRHYMDIGGGDWDAQHRPSEIRLDRVLRIDPADVRREGAIMPRSTFDEIVGSLAEVRGW